VKEIVRVVAGVLVNDQGQVLMGLRKEGKKRGGLWEWPGGKVDSYYEGSQFRSYVETDTSALIREWREEIGVGIRVVKPLAAGAFMQGGWWTISIYAVETDAPMGAFNARDHERIAFMPLDQLEHVPCTPSVYAPGVMSAVEAYIKGL
jgi:8-oxo-dGTP pyrophosphatase MutT (NUDIX family)